MKMIYKAKFIKFFKEWFNNITSYYKYEDEPDSPKYILLYDNKLLDFFENNNYLNMKQDINNITLELVEIERIPYFTSIVPGNEHLLSLQIEWDIITFNNCIFYNCSSLISLDFSKCDKVILKNDCSRFFYN